MQLEELTKNGTRLSTQNDDYYQCPRCQQSAHIDDWNKRKKESWPTGAPIKGYNSGGTWWRDTNFYCPLCNKFLEGKQIIEL